MESNQSAAREARRFLTDRVRDDWAWPDAPAAWSQSDEEVRNALDFREREYGTTSGSDEEADPAAGAGDNPYKFDSPDSIAVAVETKLESRKRKRRELLAEEMAWNEGVACFVQRRDAWTGAAAVQKSGARKHRAKHARLTAQSDPNAESLVPVARPLLKHNPIRESITSKIYPDIYNKVVVTSRTPSVPINLADMTRALVQGWKDNGEWPPKAGPLDPLPGGRRKVSSLLRSPTGKSEAKYGDDDFLANHPHVKRGVESVKKIFRMSGSHSDVAPSGHGRSASDAAPSLKGPTVPDAG
ncbi:uncharacterized protein BDZ99DRAFT_463640 [Mytilinidion resinicola]|uniref:Gag1-like clamp domain-containing protein n=1 Tax=Mytilinidion resinicola TaxID=574789 RepID=A0A6A6YIS0_9PEZI|nr:uncharacterized protein BDZ99DRAFT_463640 [Mytilinidion resinicola]KAF2808752.1 hypothetical protein BDZ99DRAFT_463640 [Mytilinidion resinicola]